MIGPIGRRLAPGDTMPMAQFSQGFPIPYILGDSLPDGNYHFDVSPPVTLRESPAMAEGNSLSGRGYVRVGAVWLARNAGQPPNP